MTRMTVVIGSTSAKHRIMAPPLEAEIAVELFGAMARRCSSMDVLNSLLGANRWIFENLPPRLKERALELIILAHDKIADDNCESDDVHHRSDDAERRWLRAVEDARDEILKPALARVRADMDALPKDEADWVMNNVMIDLKAFAELVKEVAP
jgi:hypothetical protein